MGPYANHNDRSAGVLPLLAIAAVFAAAACGPSAHVYDPNAPPPAQRPEPVRSSSSQEREGPIVEGTDAPEISRSVGVDGGVVALWPRIVPASTDAAIVTLAHEVQQATVTAIKQALPGVQIDVRPEPERVCPRAGCRGVAVGAVLASSKGGCAVVATVSAPGASPARLIPWGGGTRLTSDTVPFREPPENAVKISDFARCDQLAEPMRARNADVVAAVKSALGQQAP